MTRPVRNHVPLFVASILGGGRDSFLVAGPFASSALPSPLGVCFFLFALFPNPRSSSSSSSSCTTCGVLRREEGMLGIGISPIRETKFPVSWPSCCWNVAAVGVCVSDACTVSHHGLLLDDPSFSPFAVLGLCSPEVKPELVCWYRPWPLTPLAP